MGLRLVWRHGNQGKQVHASWPIGVCRRPVWHGHCRRHVQQGFQREGHAAVVADAPVGRGRRAELLVASKWRARKQLWQHQARRHQHVAPE